MDAAMTCPACNSTADSTAIICQICGFAFGSNKSNESDAATLKVGTLLRGGKYRIEKCLGQGGFGIAYKAKDCTVKSGVAVAVKELYPPGSGRSGNRVTTGGTSHQDFAEVRQRFLQEAEALMQFCPPNPNPDGIVDVYECFDENNTAYMVMEYVKGKNLQALVEANGPLPEAEAVDILVKIAQALYIVHGRNLLHRDVKPQNIMIRDNSSLPVLIDFGSARTFQKDVTQRPTKTDYSDGYSPLELYHGVGRYDCRTDIYSLAATGFFMLTGTVPPYAPDRYNEVELESSAKLPSGLSAYARNAIRWGLQMNAQNRPQTAHVFAQALLGRVKPSPFAARILEIQAEMAKPTIGSDAPLTRYDSEIARLKERMAPIAESVKVRDNACLACGGEFRKWPTANDRHCFACRTGQLQVRNLELRLCPVCRQGDLITAEAELICPLCEQGEMLIVSRGWEGLTPTSARRCSCCGARMETSGRRGRLDHSESQTELPLPGTEYVGLEKPLWEWNRIAPPLTKACCKVCNAQVVLTRDKLCRIISCPPDPYGRSESLLNRVLSPKALACIAQGLPEDAGDIGCSSCSLELRKVGANGALEVLNCDASAPQWLLSLGNKQLSLSDLYRMEIGKASPASGVICSDCGLEFDIANEQSWRLVLAGRKAARLSSQDQGAVRKRSDWIRLIKGLISEKEETDLKSQLEALEANQRRDLDSYVKNRKQELQAELEKMQKESADFEKNLAS